MSVSLRQECAGDVRSTLGDFLQFPGPQIGDVTSSDPVRYPGGFGKAGLYLSVGTRPEDVFKHVREAKGKYIFI